MAESIRKDLVWKNAFGDVSWQTLIKYGVMGTAVLGTSYFLVRTITRKPPMNAKGKKQKRKEDLSAPTFGSSERSSNDLARDGVEVRPNSLASRSNTTSVSQLCLYPLKSCRGILVNSFYCGEMGAELNTEHGVVRDRSWMVATADYVFLTQRKKPKMSLIAPSIEGSKLEINAPGMAALRLALSPDFKDCKPVQTAVFGESISAIDMGDEAGAWFAEFLEEPGARLIYHPHEFGGRDLSLGNTEVALWNKGDKCAFADGAPYLLLSEESVEDFNLRLEKPITWNHFRPNILVSGCAPYEEDNWDKFAIGNAELRNSKLCTRCKMTTVDPETGSLSRPDVLQTLKRYRVNQNPEWKSVYEKSPLMAINLALENAGKISVGDGILHKMN